MRKKLLICLCTFALALGMTACGSAADDSIGGKSASEYQLELSSMMTNLTALDEEGIEMNIQSASQYQGGEIVVTLLEDYKECYDANNTLTGFYDTSKVIGGFNIGSLNVGGTKAFSVAKSGKTITATIIGQFSKRDLKLTYVYDATDVAAGPTAINIEPVYTLGETMGKAGLNTIMGILIVFFMLVVMSGVIKCFEIIPALEKRAKDKAEDVSVPSPVAAPVAASAKNETDDLQLVAVIAAAIAASTGASTDSFVVRSIKKR